MKIKIKKDKKSNEMLVEYFKVVDKANFRYNVLQKIICDTDNDMTMIVDTNQKIDNLPKEQIVDYLEPSGMRYSITSVRHNNQKMMGFNIDKIINKKNKTKESLFIVELSADSFTKEFFQTCLSNYDLAIGIGSTKSFEEICEIMKFGFNSEIMFNKEYFEQSIYDSILCGMLRCSFDIEKHVLEAARQ